MPDSEDVGEVDPADVDTDKEEKDEPLPPFTPSALSKEAQEYIRRTVQAESDRKTAAELRKYQTSQAEAARKAATEADEQELIRLADEQQFEAIGRKVAGQLFTQGIEQSAIMQTAELIERQISERFSKTLGADVVEDVRVKVYAEGGSHADFALALAGVTARQVHAEQIQAEVQAQLITAGVIQREEAVGASKVASGGHGRKTAGFAEIEAGYGRGEVSTVAYEAALKARDEGNK